jgi:hypothetical protein
MASSLTLLQNTYIDSMTDFIRLGLGVSLIFMSVGIFLSFLKGTR